MATVSKIIAATVLLCSSLVGSVGHAQNNGLPGRSETIVLMISIAERGLECDLLLPWESLALKVQVLQAEADGLTAAQRLETEQRVLERKASIGCSDAGLTGYIEAARPGIEREILPPLLVAYQSLASQENPPAVFTAAAPRLTYHTPIARIDEKLAELEAKGYAPEGGGSWDAYRARISETIMDALHSAKAGDAGAASEAQSILNYIHLSAVIVEAWLADTQSEPK